MLLRMVTKLASYSEAGGTVLDNTFIGFGTGEGISAHNRTNMHMIVAGSKDSIKLGENIDMKGQHPGKLWISGLQALGTNQNTLGDLTGPIASILK